MSAYQFAGVYFALGERNKGMASLREAVEEKDFNLGLMVADPAFDSVRHDPEFAAVMNEMGLPPENWRDPPRFGNHK